MNVESSEIKTLTNEEIIRIKKETKCTDYVTPWSDSIAFARAIIKAYEEKNLPPSFNG